MVGRPIQFHLYAKKSVRDIARNCPYVVRYRVAGREGRLVEVYRFAIPGAVGDDRVALPCAYGCASNQSDIVKHARLIFTYITSARNVGLSVHAPVHTVEHQQRQAGRRLRNQLRR